jgi:aldehyde dehydrogenase (NAD+)
MATATPPRPAQPKVRLTKLFIDNQWVDAAEGGTIEALNPTNGSVIATVSAGTAPDVDKAVRSSRKALDKGPWGKMDAADRGELLYKLATLIEQHAEELAQLESLNCGKTITDSRGDMKGSANFLKYFAGMADKIQGTTLPMRGEFLSYTLRQPVGVVAQIIPWNFPVFIMCGKIAQTLACGNVMVIKPAEQTPLTALRIAELAAEAGFPPGVINVVNGFGETAGAALCVHPDVDMVGFTGHVDTAKIIQHAVTPTLKRTAFELGGKSPNVIFADCDIEQAVDGAYHAIYFHGGQCCTAGSRLFVERKIQDEFVARLAEKAKQRKVGDPLDPTTQQGPQVSKEQLDKILGYVDLGKQQGAQLVTGGAQRGSEGFFVEPTIFNNVKDEMSIARDEIFGPVVSVLPFTDMEDMIDRANNTHYGLAAGIWTKNIDKAHLYAKRIKAGTVWVNCYHVLDPSTPFGGFKQSGHGRDFGTAAIEHYTETKTVTVKLG